MTSKLGIWLAAAMSIVATANIGAQCMRHWQQQRMLDEHTVKAVAQATEAVLTDTSDHHWTHQNYVDRGTLGGWPDMISMALCSSRIGSRSPRFANITICRASVWAAGSS
jgi:hypothetical protein